MIMPVLTFDGVDEVVDDDDVVVLLEELHHTVGADVAGAASDEDGSAGPRHLPRASRDLQQAGVTRGCTGVTQS